MSISVCVATYGGQEWEDMAETRAIPSITGQADCEIAPVHLTKGTISEARNFAASLATGDWLCFLDADDELAPGYIGAMKQALEQQPLGGRLLLTPAVQQQRRGTPGAPFFYKECDLKVCNWLVIGTLISRALFWEIGGFNEHPHGLEDWNLWARAVKAGATIIRVPDAVYIAHINPQSKHRLLSRDRRAYREAYETARADAWG